MKYNKEVFSKVDEVLSQYYMTEPMIGPVLEVRVPVSVTKEDGARPPIYVQFGLLTEPIFIIGDESFRPIPVLDELPHEIAFDLVWDALRVWMKEFQLLSDKIQPQDWARNYDAMQTIYNSIEDAREYNVYVPFLDANFSNEDTEEGEDEQADGRNGVYDFATLLSDLAFYYDKKEQREKENTSKAIDKLKAVQEELVKEKCAEKVCCRDLPAGVVNNEDYAPNIRRMLERDYSGAKCIAVPFTSELFKQVSQLVRYTGLDGKRHNEPVRTCSLEELATTADHDIALISGGNNGSPDWSKYLSAIRDILQVLEQDGFDTWIIRLINDCLDDVHYIYIGLRKPRPVCNETSADIDRELTEGELKQAIDKPKAVQEKLFKEKLAEKPWPEDPDFAQIAVRKLRMDLKALKKYHPEFRQLDVAGWVVTVKRNARGRYFVKFPWVGNELNKDELDIYTTARKDKKCPVAWELIYLINKTLQEL